MPRLCFMTSQMTKNSVVLHLQTYLDSIFNITNRIKTMQIVFKMNVQISKRATKMTQYF